MNDDLVKFIKEELERVLSKKDELSEPSCLSFSSPFLSGKPIQIAHDAAGFIRFIAIQNIGKNAKWAIVPKNGGSFIVVWDLRDVQIAEYMLG